MDLPEPSEEQQDIIDYSQKNYNIIVDAVAGSGKTTTIIHICANNPNKNILVLTYNRRLKEETRNKTKSLTNVEVHSYHAFAVKYFNQNCYNDQGIIKFLKKENREPLQPIGFNLIILDEVQDLTQIYLQLVALGVRYSQHDNLQLCVFGDVRQNIYQFMNADSRFLTMMPKIFNDYLSYPWITLPLHISFRITHEIADFVNFICQDKRKMRACKYGPSVDYYVDNIFTKPQYIIKNLLQQYDPGDIFILAGSVKKSKKRTPLKSLQQALSKDGIPVYVPTDDNSTIKIEELDNKIVFSSLHQSKGLERPVVLLMGFDQGYMDIFCKEHDPTVCPNTIYVAMTRAKEKLTVLHSERSHFMSFILQDYIIDHCWFSVKKYTPVNAVMCPTMEFPVRDLIRHLNESLIYDSLKNFKWREINAPQVCLKFPHHIYYEEDGKKFRENVMDINKVVILLVFEYVFKNKDVDKISFINYVNNNIAKLRKDFRGDYYKAVEDLKTTEQVPIETYLYLSTVIESVISNYNNTLYQIKEFNWINKNLISKAVAFIRDQLQAGEKRFQEEISRTIEIEHIDRIIYNTVPLLEILPDKTIAWFICMENNITTEKKLEVIISSYLYGIQSNYVYRILNANNREILELDFNNQDVHSIVKKIVETKIGLNQYIPDSEFLQENRELVQTILNENCDDELDSDNSVFA